MFQSFLAVEIVGEQAEAGDVDVNAFAVGDGGFRTETILAMTAAGRMAGVKLALPVDFAGIQIQRIEPIMQRDFVGEFEVALVEAVQQLLPF